MSVVLVYVCLSVCVCVLHSFLNLKLYFHATIELKKFIFVFVEFCLHIILFLSTFVLYASKVKVFFFLSFRNNTN